MDVLQKWNRSIPAGNGTAAAGFFFFVFYIFETILFIPFWGDGGGGCMSVRLFFYAVM